MNDKSLECIRFYDIQVNKMVKGRGGVILFTDRGCRLFLECSRNDGFYLRDEAVTKAVSDAGFENVDTYVRNQDGELFTVGDDGHRYVMKNWFGGRECDVKSVNDVMEAVRTLARLHICLNVVSSNGVRYLRNNVNTNITKQWECMALAETADEQPESELKASESIVHNAVHFDRMEQTNELVHGSYNYHNVFLDVGNGGNAVTNFEKCHNDCQVADLYQFLRKVMEKHDWNINVAYRLVDEYDRLKPLEDDDIDMLVTLLSFPEKFWKIINQYYNAGKAWVPAKNIDKLKIVIEQNMRRRELIDKMCGM